MVYTHICVRSNFHYKKTKRKEEKKKRILLPVRTHPRENKLIEWIHARVPRKSFIRSFTYLRHVWFSVEGEYYNAYVSIKVYVVCSNDVVHDWISRKYAIEGRITRKKRRIKPGLNVSTLNDTWSAPLVELFKAKRHKLLLRLVHFSLRFAFFKISRNETFLPFSFKPS